jgi:hypothetical protein
MGPTLIDSAQVDKKDFLEFYLFIFAVIFPNPKKRKKRKEGSPFMVKFEPPHIGLLYIGRSQRRRSSSIYTRQQVAIGSLPATGGSSTQIYRVSLQA